MKEYKPTFAPPFVWNLKEMFLLKIIKNRNLFNIFLVTETKPEATHCRGNRFYLNNLTKSQKQIKTQRTKVTSPGERGGNIGI